MFFFLLIEILFHVLESRERTMQFHSSSHFHFPAMSMNKSSLIQIYSLLSRHLIHARKNFYCSLLSAQLSGDIQIHFYFPPTSLNRHKRRSRLFRYHSASTSRAKNCLFIFRNIYLELFFFWYFFLPHAAKKYFYEKSQERISHSQLFLHW